MCQNVIKKPRLYLYISLPSIIIWLFIQIMVAYEARNDGLLIIIPIIFFLPFVVTFIYITLLQLNWKVEFDNGSIIYRNWLRKKRIYRIDDMTVVHKNPNRKGGPKFYLYFAYRKITTISMYDTNLELLSKIDNHMIGK